MKRSGFELCDAACRFYPFFRCKYTACNIGCHAGDSKGETRAIFSEIMIDDILIYSFMVQLYVEQRLRSRILQCGM